MEVFMTETGVIGKFKVFTEWREAKKAISILLRNAQILGSGQIASEYAVYTEATKWLE